MRRTALITGGAGFIGTHLASHLARQGWDVTIVDDLTEGRETNLEFLGVEAELIALDIAEPGALERLSGRAFDAIFHLAAQASVPRSVERPDFDFRANVVGTFHVLEFMRCRSIPKLVFPSTVSVYSPDAEMPLKETTPIHASSPYGAAKAAAENYCFAYASSYGLNVTVLRLFNVYGPLMRKYVIHDLVRKLQRDPKRLVMLGDGNQVRDYLYVDDAARAFALAAEKGRKGDVYNVGSGNPVRIADLARKLADIMGLQKVNFECTMESWPGDIKTWFADLTKITALGFAPQMPWDEGLRRTVEFLIEHPTD
jgi:UDP-glucose 4-epimerase